MTGKESVLEHFDDPRNPGHLDRPDATGRAENPVCGDEVVLELRVAGGRIEAIGWSAFACHATIASMSLLSERVRGLTVEVAAAVTADEVRNAFEDFPRGKTHAAEVAVEALRSALGKLPRGDGGNRS